MPVGSLLDKLFNIFIKTALVQRRTRGISFSGRDRSLREFNPNQAVIFPNEVVFVGKIMQRNAELTEKPWVNQWAGTKQKPSVDVFDLQIKTKS